MTHRATDRIAIASIVDFRTSGTGSFNDFNEETIKRQWSQHAGTSNGQAGTFYFTFIIPPHFRSFPTGAIRLYTRKVKSPPSLTLTMSIDGVDIISAASILPSASDVWEQFQLTPGGTPAAFDAVLVRIASDVDRNDANHIRDLEIRYLLQ